jgi:VNT family MFS transporter (synaptic vesicle glycoprotein 2)
VNVKKKKKNTRHRALRTIAPDPTCIVFAVVAWGIIPLSADFAFGAFRYSSWNMFLTLCSLPSFLLPLWLTRFPESPKFLMEHGDFDEALDCLRHIYTLNTGKPGHEYPVRRSLYLTIK